MHLTVLLHYNVYVLFKLKAKIVFRISKSLILLDTAIYNVIIYRSAGILRTWFGNNILTAFHFSHQFRNVIFGEGMENKKLLMLFQFYKIILFLSPDLGS